jgi:hypothetical protein
MSVRFGSITAIGSFTALTSASTDYLSLTPSRCVDTPSLRTNVENAPGTPGVLVFPPLAGARILTFGGEVVIRSAGDEAGYFAAIDTLVDSLESALDAMASSPDDVDHSGGSLSCWLYAPNVPTWDEIARICTFSLVAA